MNRVAEILGHKLRGEDCHDIDGRITSALKRILVVMPNTPQEVLDQLKVNKSPVKYIPAQCITYSIAY